MNDLKAKFYSVYANIPVAKRSEIIIVVNKEPFTWNSAKIEIDNDAPLGKEILKKLKELKIIEP